jgi:hypothetical protein
MKTEKMYFGEFSDSTKHLAYNNVLLEKKFKITPG